MVKERKARRLKRRRFWAAGVNDLIAVDQHDKWKRFGLALHIGEDPFCGVIQWLRVWHNNNNPKLVLSYYLDWAEGFGCESYYHDIVPDSPTPYTPPARYSTDYTERFGLRKLWHCKCAEYPPPMA